MAVSLALTGSLSALFHATLTLNAQKLDETAETMMVMSVMYCNGQESSRRNSLYLILHSTVAAVLIFAIKDAFCEIHLATVIVITGYCLYLDVKPLLSDPTHSQVKRLLLNAVVFVLLGFTLWIIDRVACPYVQQFQLHSFWHVFTALSIYNACTIKFYVAILETGRKPLVKYIGNLPCCPKIVSQTAVDDRERVNLIDSSNRAL
jgi:hypothetical protein